jgi:hypothetical protein
MKELGSQAIIH